MRTTPLRGRRLRAVLAAVAIATAATACTDDGDDDGATPETGTPAGVEVVGEGDTYEATIRRTTGGVPHITAETRADLAFGQGWASGEDRACDLMDQVLELRGERSAWHGAGEGDANLNSDLAWRHIGIWDRAQDDFADASDDVRELLTAFTDGWNAHLAEVGADGLADWCTGAEWMRPLEPVEVYAYSRAIALQASSGAVARYIPTAQPPGAVPDPEPIEAEPAAAGAPPATPVSAPAAGPSAGGAATTATASTHTATGATAAGTAATAAALADLRGTLASNGWAIGSERTTAGGGMLVANPHFPWEGELRFWEVHLTIPGELDAYGAQLGGLPGLGIGFTSEFGWTHTVSAGNRFTAYRLTLADGDPTSYRYGDEVRPMTPNEITVEVLGDDGTTSEVTRTLWSSHYGPVIDFPGFGWTEAATISYRDANIDNDEFIEQYLAMLEADDFDGLVEAHRTWSGVPLFNTIAVSRDGRAWYADTSATPNLSDEALAAYDASLTTDPIAAIAADSGAILLDGSDPLYEWQEEDGARDPGLVPFDELPQVERDDYVFNANDSFWMAHATELLEGDYSPLHGRQRTARSARTRENATVLDDTGADGPAGDDGTFTLDELADAALANVGFTARELRPAVVERCEGAAPVAVEALAGADGAELLAAAEVDVTEACAVLADWDAVYDLDRAGPPLWREWMRFLPDGALAGDGSLWAQPFDPTAPLATPSGLAAATAGAPDPVLVALARAVQLLEVADLEPGVTLGEVQVAIRAGERIPIHGGDGRDGTTNIVQWSPSWSTLDPALTESTEARTPYASQSPLAEVDGEPTYPINYGTSFIMALELGDDGPRAKVLLTYGNTSDRSSPLYTEATQRFSDKAWRDALLTDDAIEAELLEEKVVRG